MTRDRLPELQERSRAKYISKPRDDDDDDTENDRLFLGNESDPVFQLQAQVEAIRKDLDVVELNIKVLKQKQNDIVFQGICTDQSKAELNEISDSIGKTAREVRRKLKELGNEVEKSEKQGDRSEQSRIRKIQHMTLLRMYTDVMKEYLESQESYKDKCKQLMIRQIQIVNPNYSDDAIEVMIEEDNPAIFTQDLLAEQSRARQNLDEARALNHQIKKIEQDIVEIHGLFQDLATLVHEQGDSVNRIEDEVKKTVAVVGKSKKEIETAVKRKSRNRKMCIIIIVIILVVLAIIVGVLIGVNR